MDSSEAALDGIVKPMKERARKVAGGGRRSAPAAKPAYTGYAPAAVRAWAAGQGIEVSPRGRIKADVVEKFRAAGNWASCLRPVPARRGGPGRRVPAVLNC